MITSTGNIIHLLQTCTFHLLIHTKEIALPLHERSFYKQLFQRVDNCSRSFVTKAEAMTFFSDSGIPVSFLEEVHYLKAKLKGKK